MRRQQAVPEMDLFKERNIRIGVFRNSSKKRSIEFTYGLNAVCAELSANVTDVVDPSKRFPEIDILLHSITSPMGVYDMIGALEKKPKRTRVIVGGQGVYGFWGWREVVDRIMFGRAEGVVDSIILDNSPLGYCYDYKLDPNVVNTYYIRQARKLLSGEDSVGCSGRCLFCQYSATRKTLGNKDYSGSGRFGHRVVEDRWQNIQVKTGNQTVALDGFSEQTRKRVNKPISNLEIIDTLNKVIRDLDGIMRLKVFQIVGYPWDSARSVKNDILEFRSTLSQVRSGKGRVMMLVCVTPFSPEPLTSMAKEPADIETDWRGILLHDDFRCIIDLPHINAFVLPQIPGPLTLYKRLAINRGVSIEKLNRLRVVKDIEDARAVVDGIHRRGAGIDVGHKLFIEPKHLRMGA